jgi:hypothetical protein
MNGPGARTATSLRPLSPAQAAAGATPRVGQPSPLILFGAFDRHNLGDLLLGRIAAELAARLLPGRELRFAGLAVRDLRADGGARVEALAELAAEWKPPRRDTPPPGLLQVGGEILDCSAWEAAVMLLDTAGARTRDRAIRPRPRRARGLGTARARGSAWSALPRCACRAAARHAQRAHRHRRGRLRGPARGAACRGACRAARGRRGAGARPLHPRRPRRRGPRRGAGPRPRGAGRTPARRRGGTPRRDGRGRGAAGTLRARLRGGAARGRVRRRRHPRHARGRACGDPARARPGHRAVLRRACALARRPRRTAAPAPPPARSGGGRHRRLPPRHGSVRVDRQRRAMLREQPARTHRRRRLRASRDRPPSRRGTAGREAARLARHLAPATTPSPGCRCRPAISPCPTAS